MRAEQNAGTRPRPPPSPVAPHTTSAALRQRLIALPLGVSIDGPPFHAPGARARPSVTRAAPSGRAARRRVGRWWTRRARRARRQARRRSPTPLDDVRAADGQRENDRVLAAAATGRAGRRPRRAAPRRRRPRAVVQRLCELAEPATVERRRAELTHACTSPSAASAASVASVASIASRGRHAARRTRSARRGSVYHAVRSSAATVRSRGAHERRSSSAKRPRRPRAARRARA